MDYGSRAAASGRGRGVEGHGGDDGVTATGSWRGEAAPGGVALALQGGGAHGAFTWGVVDRLLETGHGFDRVCGVSAGAMTGAALVQGWAKGGADGAREEMRRLWGRVVQVHALSPLRNGPMERWLWGWDLSNSLAWQSLDVAMRLFSPAQINPLGLNPLHGVLLGFLDRRWLCHPRAPRLHVGVTCVETGDAVLFDNDGIDVDVLLASCCLPCVFPAVRIGGRAYWDGAFSGNPPLAPLLAPSLPRHLVLVRGQPVRRRGVPGTPAEILNRMTEIACHGVLRAELAALPARVRLTDYEADDAVGHLPISSKFNGERDFLAELFEAGRRAVSALDRLVAD